MTIGGAILQNELHKHLPADFVASLPEGVALAFSAIPHIGQLPEPQRSQVRAAFADGFRVIWEVMIAIAGLGLVSSLFMKALPLHTQIDERWGIDEHAEEPKHEMEAVVGLPDASSAPSL